MDHNTRESILKAGAIRPLVNMLGVRTGKSLTFMQSHVLGTLHQLCRLNQHTQYQAVVAGLIPHLQHIITTASSALRQQALPLMCDLAYVKNARPKLWENSGVEFYLNLLSDQYWLVNAMDALSAWLGDETKRVEEVISKPDHIEKVVKAFKSAQIDSFVTLMEPLLSLLLTSNVIAKSLSTSSSFVEELISRLNHTNPQVRLNLLKILTALFDNHPHPKTNFVTDNNLYRIAKNLTQDKTVLVQKLAKKLAATFKKIEKRRTLSLKLSASSSSPHRRKSDKK